VVRSRYITMAIKKSEVARIMIFAVSWGWDRGEDGSGGDVDISMLGDGYWLVFCEC